MKRGSATPENVCMAVPAGGAGLLCAAEPGSCGLNGQPLSIVTISGDRRRETVEYIAHIDHETGREQTILEHLRNTAQIAADFAKAFGADTEAYRCGMLHDIGKYSQAFQKRIRGSAEKPDHSTAGALEAAGQRDLVAAFCVAGHHGGLPDLGNRKLETPNDPTLFGKLARRPGPDIEPYEAFRTFLPELPKPAIPARYERSPVSRYFFIKMLYSVLVDADYLDTEAFMTSGAVLRGQYEQLSEYKRKLERYIQPWWDAKSALNRKRCAILQALMDGGRLEKGLFSLTVPTGGGKTVSSMAFALTHAMEHGLNRVIYVIPYTSIIEQTQDTFEQVFGAGSVIAHHSAVTFDNSSAEATKSKSYLATENWDAPVIITTAVQFFESLYAASSSKCRKLHNIANSVVVFDEAQMLPVPFLTACTAAIAQLVENYGCSAVLCTATQPALGPLFDRLLPGRQIRELCPQALSEDSVFRRVTYVQDGLLTEEVLAERINAQAQVLCIVQSRKQAQRLYSLVTPDGRYHLSTMMYPERRSEVLAEIRERLAKGLPCRVVSTSLVEAGVDVDFPTVYRAVAGLDSIIQAAGRCNREGKRSVQDSIVHVFDTEQKPPAVLEQNIAAARRVMEKHTDISSAAAIQAYFTFLLYTLQDESALDSREIAKSIRSDSLEFRGIAKRFRMIDGCDCTVYIPEGRGKALTQELERGKPTKSLMRRLGRYAVGVYENHYRELVRAGAVEPVAENAGILRDMSLYRHETGLCFGTGEGNGVFV